MRLEKRTCELISDNGFERVYKLKCTLEESIKLSKYIIDREPLVEYKKSKINGYKCWHFTCYTENIGTGIVIHGKGQKPDIECWDEHLTFIIPKYWEKTLDEGFYEKGEYKNKCDALKHYIRKLSTNNSPEIDYCLQYQGSNGDEEYEYLEALCDIENALISREDIATKNIEYARDMLINILPLGIRTIITIKVPKDFKIQL